MNSAHIPLDRITITNILSSEYSNTQEENVEQATQTSPLNEVRITDRGNAVVLMCNDRQHTFSPNRGWEYLLCLLSQPGQEFRVAQLMAQGTPIPAQYRALAQLPESYLEQQQIRQFDSDTLLPLSDPQTIKQICARMNYLIQKEAQLMEYCDYAALDDIRDEKERLQRYLSEVLNPQGRIRISRDRASRDVRSVHRALLRVMQAIAEVEPELGAYLRRSVHTWNRVGYTPGDVEIRIVN